MSAKIRVGILGCAAIAKRSVVPAFLMHPDFEVKAVASRSSDKSAEFVRDVCGVCVTPAAIRCCSYDQMVSAADVDLVYCPLPTGLHHEWVGKCLRNGKHVLCEKSLACDLEQVGDLVGLAREKGRFLMESFQFRFHAQNTFVKSLLDRQAIGEIRQLIVRFGIPPFQDGIRNIRYSRDLGGGALLDNGAYTLKAATYLLGSDLQVLCSLHGGESAVYGNVDLFGSIMMKTGSGIPIQTAYGFDHFYQNGYEIWGTEGKIVTTRAFTARSDYSALVVLDTKTGRHEQLFQDDHFARLLDYVSGTIASGDYETEYEECLLQGSLIQQVKDCMR